ncbi:YafY family protein [Asticcacaulis sp. EMRT-3]|uniref:helix-turn-helix transcriptional regulator n=1 Tax=Asticcacaulis sp. EMRT-3 TaxID=3040349 RepID=UPI0024AEE55F|nr:YafY family protein [Asticcacaulis sp. EMRT-3]MDI7774997.1 YafY family protein [Asticcacaulis sp. EMRT-3]
MTRATRLLDLLQLLRRHRYPVSGAELARELDISLRTLYRDIAALQAQGAHIEGEPGVGYVLRPGYMLPPLMLSPEELEALVLGTSWVADRGDARLGEAAQNALTKIVAVLPKDMANALDSTGLMVVPSWSRPATQVDLGDIRASIRAECRVLLRYVDLKEQASQRVVWPIALGFFEHVRIVVVWCELRQAFRHLRADRIMAWEPLAERYPKRRFALMKAWKSEREAEQAHCEAGMTKTALKAVSVA